MFLMPDLAKRQRNRRRAAKAPLLSRVHNCASVGKYSAIRRLEALTRQRAKTLVDGGTLPSLGSTKLRRLPALGPTPCVELRRGVNRKLITGAALHRLSKRHDSSRNVIRTWVPNYGVGDFDEDAAASKALQQYEARIAALERLVGKQALESEFPGEEWSC